ncbi:HNH endonuclease-domain-containing protein [Lipomyces doorenjongii]|uniref:HNH endonuclease-domain-containing protein n=1 Tax=Lipomyces doorenjongii TaxID=383834 RepID=UPI0034CD6469
MMTADRSEGRDVHIFAASDPQHAIGGLWRNDTITQRTFLSMLEILIVSTTSYDVYRRSPRAKVQYTDQLLEAGDYDIESEGTIVVTDERYCPRTSSTISSLSASGRLKSFTKAVRERDGRCVISGLRNPQALYGRWYGFEAAHIFPLALEAEFTAHNYRRWITNAQDGDALNSVQNGLLLSSIVHKLFDQYQISINPDDDYRIICFLEDFLDLSGRTVDPICRNPLDDRRVSDGLLRWHFRHAVFANMRGAGEPTFEDDFPPGSDMLGTIRNGTNAGDWMEFQLNARLRGTFDSQGTNSIEEPLGK